MPASLNQVSAFLPAAVASLDNVTGNDDSRFPAGGGRGPLAAVNHVADSDIAAVAEDAIGVTTTPVLVQLALIGRAASRFYTGDLGVDFVADFRAAGLRVLCVLL